VAVYNAQGVGKLKEVIVHCPGDELDILNPENLKDYLFDGLVYKEEAQEEHNQFVAKLEGAGVRVNRLTELLKRIAKDKGGFFLRNVIKKLPNLFFIRDLAVITSSGAIIANMHHAARGVEPAVIKSILEEMGVPILCEIDSPGNLEGGDILFLDKDTMLVGLSERTNEEGIRQVREAWLKEGRTLAKIPIRLVRESMHLDAVIGFISKNCISIHLPSIVGNLTVYWMDNGKQRQREPTIEDFLAVRGIGAVEVTWAEQFRMACNALMVEPGKVIIGYQRSFSEDSLRALQEIGIELTMLYLPQLFLGAGGPHCMTLELEREEE
jgi:arginine deiminase